MDDSIDYRLVCRTCLASEAEFYKLDARTFFDDDERISFLECLKFCTKLEDVPEFPIYICTDCSTALQVAYNFMKNALEAHEILRQKLCSGTTRANGQFGNAEERRVSFRCKICEEKVETKKSLKEHVKLHLDLISYNCELCAYQTKKRSSLNEHYIVIHGLLATKDQLKPHTKQSEIKEPQIKKHETNQPPIEDCSVSTEIVKTVGNELPILQPQPFVKTQSILQRKLLHPQQHSQQQPMNVAQFLQEIPLEMATVIASAPSTSNEPIEISSSLQNFGNELNLGNEMSIGNEFVVMQDGTVQEVISNGVLINYINAGEGAVALDNGIIINNLMMQSSNETEVNTNGNSCTVNGAIQCDTTKSTDGGDLNVSVDAGSVTMDIDDIIVEDRIESIVPEVQFAVADTGADKAVAVKNSTVDVTTKEIRCKMCKSKFSTQDFLKEHMLSHNEIPHFFCEICNFYTFFKIDLTQHYKTIHSIQPKNRQLQPKNKVHFNVPEGAKKVFLCEMCIYDTPVKAILRRHYLSKHQVEATEMQLRPVRVSSSSSSTASVDEEEPIYKSSYPKTNPKKDFPHGAQCRKCNKVFYWESDRNEHYNRNCDEEPVPETAKKVTVIVNNSQTVEPNTIQDGLEVDVEKLIACTKLRATVMEPPPAVNTSACGSNSIVPPDAVPQIVETDSIVDNILDFDFNGDAIFEDDSEENDDEEFQDLVLTTDDEQEYAKETDENSSGCLYNAYCVQCNKNFVTHYQFENHMFVHRGLAPYRCEMCTNLYNTKRDLIRHYHAVHKSIPTRDMIQAKGDKATEPNVENVILERPLVMEKSKEIRLMCAKCPYEVIDISDIKAHLSIIHGSDDDYLILQKLPYECPKCIRTFASYSRLNHHIERNHSFNLICHEKKDDNDNITCKRCDLKSL